MEEKNETKLNNLLNKIRNIDFDSNDSITDFINTTDSEMLTGTDGDGNDITFAVAKGEFLDIATYLDNGFIKKNIYTIDGEDLIREEIYEPSRN